MNTQVPVTQTETRIAKLHTRNDGIIHSTGRDDLVESIEDAHEQIEAVKRLSPGKACPLLADARRLKKVSKEAREFYASMETGKHCSAVAIMTESKVSQVLVNFFMKINKPVYPMKMFTNEADALKWLKTFVN